MARKASDLSRDTSSKKLLKKKFLNFAIFFMKLAFLCFFVTFGFLQPSTEIIEISDAFTKELLLFTIILTALVIILQSWITADFDEVFKKNLLKFEKVFGQQPDVKKKTWVRLNFATIVNLLIVLTCFGLSTVPLFCDKEYGIWEILLVSIYLIKFTSFRYALAAGEVCKKILKIRGQIEEIAENRQNLENFSQHNLQLFNRKFKDSLQDQMKVAKMINGFIVIQSLVKLINKHYGFSILCIVFTAFLSITNCGYNFFIEIETRHSTNVIIENLCLFLSFVLALVMIASSCQRCVNEGRLLGALLHSIDDFDEHDIVKKFSLQLIHQEVKFNAAGFFNVGCPLLVSVLASFMTYEIILIQFFFGDLKH